MNPRTDAVEQETLTELLMLTGERLLENGAETFRVETSILNMYNALGGSGEINVIALGTQLSLDIFDGVHHTAVKRIRRRGVNLEKFAIVNRIARDVCAGKLSPMEARALLRELDKVKTGNKAVQVLAASALVAGMFVFMIGGSPLEAAVAFACCLIVQSCWLFVKRSASLIFVANIASGFLTALIASIGALIWDCSVERVIFGAMLPLFPGVAMMTAIRDTINGDLSSGVVRGVDAVLTAVGLALGSSLGLLFVALSGVSLPALPMITMTGLPFAVFAFLVSLGSGLMLSARIKTALAGAIIGGIVYLVFMLSNGTTIGVFLASVTLAALSEAAARVLKAPSTIFLIIGVYPLVPGAGIYKTAELILQNNIPQALARGNGTVAELLFMVGGVAIVSAFFKVRTKVVR